MGCNISILIPTLNEEINLFHSLESCVFANQVFVLDSGSTDTTQAIAESAGAWFVHHPWEGFARQKNWGLNSLPITSELVFILDADEVITSPLRDELLAVASGKMVTDKAGFYINRYFV